MTDVTRLIIDLGSRLVHVTGGFDVVWPNYFSFMQTQRICKKKKSRHCQTHKESDRALDREEMRQLCSSLCEGSKAAKKEEEKR